MVSAVGMEDIAKRIALSDGRIVLLLDRLAKEKLYGRLECARNIYLVDRNGMRIWQVESAFDENGGPFTNIIVSGAEIHAYRWDGGIYVIDTNTGKAVPSQLTR